MDEDVVASVGGDAALDERQDELQSTLECGVPRRFKYGRDGVAVERSAEFPRQSAALDRQQVVVGRLA